MNERKHPEAGVFTGCILWPTDPVARCSAAVVPALQHCSQLLHPAAAANLVMMLLSTTLQWNVWHDSFYVLLLQQQSQQSLQGIYRQSPSPAEQLPGICSGRSCCRPQLQSAVSCFLQYSSATGSGGAAAENCIFYSATLVPAITLSRYLGQRCEASSQVSVFPSTLWFTSTSPHDLEVLFSANIRFHYKAFVDFGNIYFLQNKSRRSIDTPGSGYYSWEFLQKPIWVTTNFCSPLFLFSSMLDVMWRFCGSFSACFYCFSKIGSRTEHGSYKKLHCEHKRTTTWGESFLVEVVTGISVPNPWNKKIRFRHWCRVKHG